MISVHATEYDVAGLTRMVSTLDGALFGSGQDGDIHRLLKTEAGQLAWDISERLGPSERQAGEKGIQRDVKRFLTNRPAFSNLDEGQQYSSYADFTWLQAGPHFLVGINDEDNLPRASSDDALAILRAGQSKGSRGKAYLEIGSRGSQHIYRLNRTRVSASAFRAVMRSLSGKVGQLRASFAFTAAELIPNKRIASWIRRHFASRAGGKAIFNSAGLSSPTEPFIEFGSTARGVESQPKIVDAIHAGVEGRKYIMDAKIKKVLAGYSYDWNTGRVFLRREAQETED